MHIESCSEKSPHTPGHASPGRSLEAKRGIRTLGGAKTLANRIDGPWRYRLAKFSFCRLKGSRGLDYLEFEEVLF